MGQSQSQSQTHIGSLPNEVGFSILQHLAPQEIKSAVLVCKAIREIAEKPKFWTWAVIKVNTKDDIQKLKRPRFQMVQEIDVTQGSDGGTEAECLWIKEEGLADLFQVIGDVPTVKKIRGLEFCQGIDSIEPNLVVSVFNSLEKLMLCSGHDFKNGEEEEMHLDLTEEQLELLFKAVAEKTNLKFLEVSFQRELSNISPELFAAAVSNVEEVILRKNYVECITDEQFEALFSKIAVGDRLLRKFELWCYYIEEEEEMMDPDLLSRAFNRLEEVDTWKWCTVEQMTAILSGLLEGESRLTRLMFMNVEFSQNLDQDLVRRVKDRIGEFYT